MQRVKVIIEQEPNSLEYVSLEFDDLKSAISVMTTIFDNGNDVVFNMKYIDDESGGINEPSKMDKDND